MYVSLLVCDVKSVGGDAPEPAPKHDAAHPAVRASGVAADRGGADARARPVGPTRAQSPGQVDAGHDRGPTPHAQEDHAQRPLLFTLPILARTRKEAAQIQGNLYA